MLIHNLFEKSVEQFPDKNAVFCKDRWVSYGYLESHANKVANFLFESGVKPGERVAILWDNSIEYVIAYYGILKAGGVVVALNTETTAKSLAYLLQHSDAVACIATRKYFRFLVQALSETPTVKLILSDAEIPPQHREQASFKNFLWDSVMETGMSQRPVTRRIDIDLGAIVYTSGSTGEPKGVMHSHLNVVSNNQAIVEYLALTEHDRIMVVLPFFYVYGKTLLNTHLSVGGSVVIDNRFTYPNVVLDTMEQQKTTGFAGVPSTFMILLDKSTVRSRHFPDLRYVTQAGGAMAPSVQKQVIEAFNPAKLFIMYGATELSPRLTWLPPERLEEKLGSIGIPVPNADAFIADEQGNRLPPHREGEIVGRGSNVMMGYWKNPEGTAKVIRNGGLYYTGDMGKMDEEGFLYVVGRSKDILKVGGNRVSAKEIEEAILSHSGISDVAVISVSDHVLGEAAKAFIVLKNGGGISQEDVKKYLAGKLASFKVPKFISFVDTLPKNKSGKIMKNQLKDQS